MVRTRSCGNHQFSNSPAFHSYEYNSPGMSVSINNPEITTPAFLVERGIVQRNSDAMREKARQSGVPFRPHMKSHKTLEVARMQFGGETGPVTVSTLAEAEFFAAHGFDDITYAVPISPDKLERTAALAPTIKRLNVLIDSFEALHALEEFHRQGKKIFNGFRKIGCGYHRAGVDPELPESLHLATALANPNGGH